MLAAIPCPGADGGCGDFGVCDQTVGSCTCQPGYFGDHCQSSDIFIMQFNSKSTNEFYLIFRKILPSHQW